MLATSRTGEWDEVTTEKPCEVCGKGTWCARKRDGDACRCMREANPPYGMQLVKESRDGGHVFAPVDSTFKPAARSGTSTGTEAKRANPDHLDRVYQIVLASLVLTNEHRDDLHRRGLDDDQIRNRGYRSLGQHRQNVIRAVDALDVDGVPGFYVKEDSWRFGGAVGLLIPVRDEQGRIVALSVRADEPKDSAGKYTWLSSKKYGGAGSGAPTHVPTGAAIVIKDTVRITEGALKADIATALSGMLTLGVAGTKAWRVVFSILRDLHVITVRLAFDQDAERNPHVAHDLKAFHKALVDAGFNVELEVWDGDAAKGIDDALAGC